MSYSNICIYILGGLSIFLYGLNLMRASLLELSKGKLKQWIQRSTKTNFLALITGIFSTILIQSSSGITAITVALTSAGYFPLSKAIAIMLGANIGTTFTAFLFTIKIEEYALLIIVLGSFLYFFEKIKSISSAIIGFGLLFFGLFLMNVSFDEISHSTQFLEQIQTITSNQYKGLFGGTIMTALIQSSSAVIAIVQNLYANNTIPLFIGISIMLGANIGTTIPSLIMAIGASKEAKISVYINIVVNMIGAIIFMIFLIPLSKLILYLEHTFFLHTTKAISIAISHTIFNILSSFIVFFYINKIISLLNQKKLIYS